MQHKASNVIISITHDDDILFIRKETKNGQTTSHLATFLDHDGVPFHTTNRKCVTDHFRDFLHSKLESLRANEFITMTITTHKLEK